MIHSKQRKQNACWQIVIRQKKLTKQLFRRKLRWNNDATTTSQIKKTRFDSVKNNNTNWKESKRAHWLQAHRQSAGCRWGVCWFHKANTAVISTRTRTERQRKRENRNRHWQLLERSQLSDKGRDRAIQLIVVEAPVDFTKHKLLLLALKHEPRDTANDRIVIVTHKISSAVNCPIEDGIVPFSWLS